jgi:hypothetical protein
MFLLLPGINPCSDRMNAPQRPSPDQLPDPWLLDTEGLLSELARIRELALRIPPVRNDIIGTNQQRHRRRMGPRTPAAILFPSPLRGPAGLCTTTR